MEQPPPGKVILVLHGDVHNGVILDFLDELVVKVRKENVDVSPSQMFTHIAGSGNLRYAAYKWMSLCLFLEVILAGYYEKEPTIMSENVSLLYRLKMICLAKDHCR
jgi:hypothetical protein